MDMTRTTKAIAIYCSLVFTGILLAGENTAYCGEKSPADTQPVACGRLLKFQGDIEMLNSDRSGFLETQLNKEIPCGAWMAVEDGWAELWHYSSDAIVRVGPNSYLEIFSDAYKGNGHAAHLVLFKGKLLIDQRAEGRQTQIVTANSKIDINPGKALVLYVSKENDTQLVSLKGKHKIVNRFNSEMKMEVPDGAASRLGFYSRRIFPSVPLAASPVSLTRILDELEIDSNEKRAVIATAKARRTQKYAVFLDQFRTFQNEKAGRKIASAPPEKSADVTYMRHSPKDEDENAEKAIVKKIVGGAPEGEDILFPNRLKNRGAQAKLIVEDRSKNKFKQSKRDNDEIERLLRELSEIRVTH